MGKATTSNNKSRFQNLGGLVARKSPTERFIEKISVDPLTGCWVWQAKLRDGYAAFRDGEWQTGHIWAYERFIGKIHDKELCCHVCDNRKCVNPYHIFLGSNKDNTVDAMMKDRMKIRGQLKLRIEDVKYIRKLFSGGKSKRWIANKFGVSWQSVHHIIINKTYRFV